MNDELRAKIESGIARFDKTGQRWPLDHEELAEAIKAKWKAWQGFGLVEADFSGADLTDANLLGAELPRANLENTNLARANLRDASLRNAYLRMANLEHVNLDRALLDRSILCDANLTGASLTRADLERVDLRGANLTNATLTGSYLLGIVASAETTWHNTTLAPGVVVDGYFIITDVSSREDTIRVGYNRAGIIWLDRHYSNHWMSLPAFRAELPQHAGAKDEETRARYLGRYNNWLRAIEADVQYRIGGNS
jgi:hypothetical protein